MTPQSLTQLQTTIDSLNGSDKPFAIKMEGDQIIGSWNILNIETMGINHENKNYTITFHLDEAKHEFNYKEHSENSESGVRITPDGGLSFGTSSNSFSGKEFGKHEAGVVLGFGMKNNDQPTQAVGVAAYNFDNGQIKNPIISALVGAGWNEKKNGFLGKLFS